MRNLPDIKNQLSSHDLFEAFKKQLIKDCEQSNFFADFVGGLEPDYWSIRNKIISELQRNEGKSDSTHMQLLYRIDISEAQLRKYLSENKNDNYFSVMAELIIKRVLQKVVIKRFYKNQQ